jgi:hypothetical protein
MSTSPLSPQMIAAAGVGSDRSDMQSVATRLDMEASMPSRPGTSMAGPTLSPVGGLPMERSASAAEISNPASRKPERMQSRSRREHPTHQSHSRIHRDDQKTVGEYALHVLFTSVSGGACMWFVSGNMSCADSTHHSLLHKRKKSLQSASPFPLTPSPTSTVFAGPASTLPLIS